MSGSGKIEDTIKIKILPLNPFPLEDTPYDDPEEGSEHYPLKGNYLARWKYWRESHNLAYMFAHYLFFGSEFLFRHFFVLSGSMRIYLITYFILFGGVFYAVAPTAALGCVFFLTSILISLTLANFARWINNKTDSNDREKQLIIKKLTDETYEQVEVKHAVVIEEKQQETDEETSPTTPRPRLSHKKWEKIEDMKGNTFSWLNYKYVLSETYYNPIIFTMDILVVVAAMWNIIDEILRWQAVLPFSSALAAMGPFWVVFALSLLAVVCLGCKLAFTYPVTNVRKTNMLLLQKTRDLFEHTAEQNPILEKAIQIIEREQQERDQAPHDVKSVEVKETDRTPHDESRSLLPNNTPSSEDNAFPTISLSTKETLLAIIGGIIIGGLLAFLLYIAIPASVPLWSIIIVSALASAITGYCSFRLLASIIYKYKIRGSVKAQRAKSARSERVLEDLEHKHTPLKKDSRQQPLTAWQKFFKGINSWTTITSLWLSGLSLFLAWYFAPALPLWALVVIPVLSIPVFMCLLSAAAVCIEKISKTKSRKAAKPAKPSINRKDLTVWEKFRKDVKPWTILISLALAGLLTVVICFLAPSLPLWAMITLPLFSFLAITCIFADLLARFHDRAAAQTLERVEACTIRQTIEGAVIRELMEAKTGYSEEQIQDLASLAYSVWKLKNLHRFKQQRNLFDWFLDKIGVPVWNAAITIFPTFFILNGICVTVFLLPSVLSSWPLFFILLIPSVILAMDFGRRKLGDNEHDLINAAAHKIIAEITNKTDGKLTLCLRKQKEDRSPLFKLEDFGLKQKLQEPSEEQRKIAGKRRQSISFVPTETALSKDVDTLGIPESNFFPPSLSPAASSSGCS